ncbi:uncharacterized protein LOC131807183 [Musca domestica]|uniref:Uncharacterized protein LOC131807183 n=1 Tax=Musca domestica TaxID=7370 RepID=A0ABM3VQX5_MUSDO|nr:uncharacterized protein LOC131807183 [Musca domestica]
MENLSTMAASLPIVDDNIPMSDEEREFEDNNVAPLGSQDSAFKEIIEAPNQESAPGLQACQTSPSADKKMVASPHRENSTATVALPSTASVVSPHQENCTATVVTNPGFSSQMAVDTLPVLLPNIEEVGPASPHREIARACSASTWTIPSASPHRELAHARDEQPTNSTATIPCCNRPVAGPNRPQGPKCLMCMQRHFLKDCPDFHKLPCEKKIRFVVQNNFCSNCLTRSHILRDCFSIRRCKKCGSNHHTLLHSNQILHGKVRPSGSRDYTSRAFNSSPSSNSISSAKIKTSAKRPSVRSHPISSAPSGAVRPIVQSIQPIVTLGPTMVVQIVLPDRKVPVRALLDPCAGHSRICSTLTSKLQLSSLNVGQDLFCQLTLQSFHDQTQLLRVSALSMPLRHVVTPAQSAPDLIKDHYAGMQLADPEFYKSAHIALILGPDVYPKVIKSQTHSSPGFPWAQLTIFGWVVSGPCPL